MKHQRIKFEDLNAKQKENYNFQKIAAILADYGYSCLWLNDDWQGADFIANHIDGIEYLKVQLKGRITISKKYIGKNIYIAFRYNGDTYLYPHDVVMNLIFKEMPKTELRDSWVTGSSFSWPKPSKLLLKKLAQYKLEDVNS